MHAINFFNRIQLHASNLSVFLQTCASPPPGLIDSMTMSH